jgi:glutamate dehydrogenase
MAVRTEKVEPSLVDSLCSRVRERVDTEHVGQVEEFVRQYYRWMPAEDLAGRNSLDLYGAALAHWGLARRRAPGEPKVRLYNPVFEQHGYQSTHTVVEIVSDDMPFLVDSVSMAINRRGYRVHLMIHPVMRVQRDADGELERVLPAQEDVGHPESVIHVEIDRQTEPDALAALHDDLLEVLGDVRAAVEDWPAMTQQARDLAASIDHPPPPVSDAERREANALLEWLADDHFVFLGYREYELVREEGEERLKAIADTGLGILRAGSGRQRASSRAFDDLPPRVRALARAPRLLILTKANSRATVHRPAHLDYVGVKRFDADGNVVGERRFLGLYTSASYKARPHQIPLVRHKAAAVIERAAFPPGSHDEKALVDILETLPRDELFQVHEDELFEIAMAIHALGDRQRVRLLVRRDEYERFLSCLLFLPRDRFNTQNRERVGEMLREAFGGESVDFTLRLTEWLVRIHFMVRTGPGALPEVDVEALERRIVETTRSWTDALLEALVDELGEEAGSRLFRRYGDAFPAAYQEDHVARSAVADVRRLEEMQDGEPLAMTLYRPIEAADGVLRCKLYRSGEPVMLSAVLPMFEHAGLQVADERPYGISPRDGAPAWVYDFGLVYDGELDVAEVREDFEDAFIRVWRGEVESDRFNGLVLRARLTWREVVVLRAIARYLRQAGTTFSNRYMEQTLIAHPDLARTLVELFAARFDPEHPAGHDVAEAIATRVEEAIERVESLDEDRILRNFLSVIRATLRTNHFQPDPDGEPKPYLSLKLDPARIPLLPSPRPRFEVFVYSPRTEGVHLRGGHVARGGLRWSDRREDFRTEVLGLMKAQMVKNALIVPVGAKGGFVVKRPREPLRDEVVACYRTFIGGLLDVTDNIVEGEVVPPRDVVRFDGDDPYLVVAADKGTATFSDIANGVAADYGFWLGDAFASGGSAGYDHKKMGITARGAWESVRRHFRERGLDVQSEPFTVVGVGDMSGDVFGNGMLLSEHIRLVAAFDHRHVFLDPDPDAAASFEERKRLFGLPRSSWADYDASLISEGGGVWPRSAKSIPLSDEARAALGIELEEATPNELIRAILRAPVALLWNGGIGTYVRASTETDADVGDKANDAVRVTAAELCCQVVGEGGNLGLTQRARIEFALADGGINTDAIDNAGGVNSSDREVNIKILLDAVVAAGDMTRKQRDKLLAQMTDDVVRLVLRDNGRQAQALSLAAAQAPSMLDVHQRFIRHLEHVARLDRELEALPSMETIEERRAAGAGLTRPELAVLFSYAKVTLFAELVDSNLPEDPFLSKDLARYFPQPLPERFGDAMAGHRLRREIIATHVTNSLVDRAGTTFVFRMHEETGAPASEIARAYAVAREIYAMPEFWAEVEALDHRVPAVIQTEMLLDARKLIERATRWLLRSGRRPLDIAAAVTDFEGGVDAIAGALPGILVDSDREAWDSRVAELASAGVPAELAARAASLGALFGVLDVVQVAVAAGEPIDAVAALHFRVGARLRLHWLRDRVAVLPRDDRWQTMARAALRDDLFVLHRELTDDVLRESPPPGTSEERLAAWIAANRPPLDRCMGILDDIRAGGTYDLTTLPVALREIRALIRETSAVVPD